MKEFDEINIRGVALRQETDESITQKADLFCLKADCSVEKNITGFLFSSFAFLAALLEKIFTQSREERKGNQKN